MLKSYYQVSNPHTWHGRKDPLKKAYLYESIQIIDLNKPLPVLPKGFAFLGFACDLGVQRNHGRKGAANGPFAIRQALGNMALHTKVPLYDAGDIFAGNNDLQDAQILLGQKVHALLSADLFPLVIGGGHETAWGHYLGLQAYLDSLHPATHPLQIINFDAHFDLRALPADKVGTSGTPFFQIATHCQSKKKIFDYTCLGIQPYANTTILFETAKKLNVNYLTAMEIHADKNILLNYIKQQIKKEASLYLSICLDVFSAQQAPAVSAPQALGLQATDILQSLRYLAQSPTTLSLDLVEYAPVYDIDHRTAKLASFLIIDFIHHAAERFSALPNTIE